MSESLRFNQGKPMLSYFRRSFRQALHCIARIMEFGAAKYDDDNWRLGAKPDKEYFDSLERHLDYFIEAKLNENEDGEYDADSGCHHLGHAIWNLCALFELNYGARPVINEEVFKERCAYWEAKKKERVKGNTAQSHRDQCFVCREETERDAVHDILYDSASQVSAFIKAVKDNPPDCDVLGHTDGGCKCGGKDE